jgi:hypothetical protein
MDTASIIGKTRAKWGVPEAKASDAFLTAWLDEDLAALVDPNVFGTSYEAALSALAAHIAITVDPEGAYGTGVAGPSGQVASISTLSMSASFSTSSGQTDGSVLGDEALLATKPGRWFIHLRSQMVDSWAPMVVG